jgi:hypothetical protein
MRLFFAFVTERHNTMGVVRTHITVVFIMFVTRYVCLLHLQIFCELQFRKIKNVKVKFIFQNRFRLRSIQCLCNGSYHFQDILL